MKPFRPSSKKRVFCRFISSLILLTFGLNSVFPSPVLAQNISIASMLSPGIVFQPVMLKGLSINPQNPLEFDFFVDPAELKLSKEDFNQEATKLIKYFLASLTVPEKDMWVNLSPYEKNRIIPEQFGVTEMGRDLLAQDYILKQLTASLMYPESELGKGFWNKVHKKVQEKYGKTDIPVDTFNKVWIVPAKAVVYEHNGAAFVVENKLKVMMEEDYLAMQNADKTSTAERSTLTSIVREIILPEIEKEVNTSKHFATLRQISNAMVLATWYKRRLKDSLLGQVYVDRNKTKGIDIEDKEEKQKIYDQYLETFKKGVYNYIKEEYDPATQEMIQRKYVSGGANMDYAAKTTIETDMAMLSVDQQDSLRSRFERVKTAMVEMGPKAKAVAPDAAMMAEDSIEFAQFKVVILDSMLRQLSGGFRSRGFNSRRSGSKTGSLLWVAPDNEIFITDPDDENNSKRLQVAFAIIKELIKKFPGEILLDEEEKLWPKGVHKVNALGVAFKPFKGGNLHANLVTHLSNHKSIAEAVAAVDSAMLANLKSVSHPRLAELRQLSQELSAVTLPKVKTATAADSKGLSYELSYTLLTAALLADEKIFEEAMAGMKKLVGKPYKGIEHADHNAWMVWMVGRMILAQVLFSGEKSKEVAELQTLMNEFASWTTSSHPMSIWGKGYRLMWHALSNPEQGDYHQLKDSLIKELIAMPEREGNKDDIDNKAWGFVETLYAAALAGDRSTYDRLKTTTLRLITSMQRVGGFQAWALHQMRAAASLLKDKDLLEKTKDQAASLLAMEDIKPFDKVMALGMAIATDVSERATKFERVDQLFKEIRLARQDLKAYLESNLANGAGGLEHLLIQPMALVGDAFLVLRMDSADKQALPDIRKYILSVRQLLGQFSDFSKKDELLTWAQRTLANRDDNPQDTDEEMLHFVYLAAEFIIAGNFTQELADKIMAYRQALESRYEEILSIAEQLTSAPDSAILAQDVTEESGRLVDELTQLRIQGLKMKDLRANTEKLIVEIKEARRANDRTKLESLREQVRRDPLVRFYQIMGGLLDGYDNAPITTRDIMSIVYSPYVGTISKLIEADPELSAELGTLKEFKDPSLYVISDGSALLGYGNMGADPMASVAKGKAALIRHFGGVKANVALVDNKQLWEEWKTARKDATSAKSEPGIIAKAKARMKELEETIAQRIVDRALEIRKLHPNVGFMMEDIARPLSIIVERKLNDLGIPTMHDDQHGTAIIVGTGALRALQKAGFDVKDKESLKNAKVIIQGAGASGYAVAKNLRALGVGNIIILNSKGAIYRGMKDFDLLHPAEQALADFYSGDIEELKLREGETMDITSPARGKYIQRLLQGAHGYIGLSEPKIYDGMEEEILSGMAKNAFVFTLANPDGEFSDIKLKQMMEDGKVGSAAIGAFKGTVETLNNSSAFPGWLRGLSEAIQDGLVPNGMTDETIVGARMAATQALAGIPLTEEQLAAGKLVANSFLEKGGYDTRLTAAVSKAVYLYLYENVRAQRWDISRAEFTKFDNLAREIQEENTAFVRSLPAEVQELIRFDFNGKPDAAMLGEESVGGINLDPELMDLQIKRDGNGIPLPLPQQPLLQMNIEGFLPVILNVTPATNLPLLLGLPAEKDTPKTELSRVFEPASQPKNRLKNLVSSDSK